MSSRVAKLMQSGCVIFILAFEGRLMGYVDLICRGPIKRPVILIMKDRHNALLEGLFGPFDRAEGRLRRDVRGKAIDLFSIKHDSMKHPWPVQPHIAGFRNTLSVEDRLAIVIECLLALGLFPIFDHGAFFALSKLCVLGRDYDDISSIGDRIALSYMTKQLLDELI